MLRGRARLYVLPPAVAPAGALENITVAVLALSHDGAPSPLACPAAVFTLVKTVLFVATLACDMPRRDALAVGPHTTSTLTSDSAG